MRPNRGRHRAPTRRSRIVLAVAVVGIVAGLTPASVSASAVTGAAFVATKTVTRTNYNNGVDVAVDSRNVTVSVSQTLGLRDRQGISVTWSGAHPTNGIAEDNTSPTGAFEEYPVLVMQCRGVDSTSVPAAKQVSPRRSAGRRHRSNGSASRPVTSTRRSGWIATPHLPIATTTSTSLRASHRSARAPES